MGKINDLTGMQFGRLTAVEKLPPHGKNTAVMWLCNCECGGTAIVRGTDLTRGHTLSCGCYKQMRKTLPNSELRLHRIWQNMKQRCANPKNKDYRYYGGRGITVCDEWAEFEPFFYWAMSNGYKDGLTIERKDNDGNYCPSNCEWITAARQHRNTGKTKKYTLYGKEFTLAELCRIYGQPRSTVAERLKKGIPIDDAIKKGGRNKLNNKLLELSDTLKLLKERKSELDAEAKKIEEEIDGVTTEMIGIMTTEELTSFKRDGTTFSLVVQEYPSAEPDRKPELWDAMRSNGYGDLFSINSKTLSATVKELMTENGGALPEWLEGLIKIAEKNSIRMTKSKKY